MYLIMKSRTIDDKYKRDANRIPFCVVEDYTPYFKIGYEIYTINSDGTLTLVKDYNVAGEKGVCVARWVMDSDIFLGVEKFKGMTRKDITDDFIKSLKKKYGFTDPAEKIRQRIVYVGDYADEVNGEWIIISEYEDDNYLEDC